MLKVLKQNTLKLVVCLWHCQHSLKKYIFIYTYTTNDIPLFIFPYFIRFLVGGGKNSTFRDTSFQTKSKTAAFCQYLLLPIQKNKTSNENSEGLEHLVHHHKFITDNKFITHVCICAFVLRRSLLINCEFRAHKCPGPGLRRLWGNCRTSSMPVSSGLLFLLLLLLSLRFSCSRFFAHLQCFMLP